MIDDKLKEKVREVYSRVAEKTPEAGFPFPVGRAFAEAVGYPPALLDELPAACVESFAGIYPLSVRADLLPGEQVLDVGCGAGLDALIAARRVGEGRVVGVDFSEAMLARARDGAAEAGSPARFVLAEAGHLADLEVGFDVVMANGILNLNPDREALLAEMARLLKPGGRFYGAEIVGTGERTNYCGLDNWFR
ncbi:MAG: methyltransferase domain-containing protein [Pseudomonadota bacterium]